MELILKDDARMRSDYMTQAGLDMMCPGNLNDTVRVRSTTDVSSP